jgi:hypothetical protein
MSKPKLSKKSPVSHPSFSSLNTIRQPEMYQSRIRNEHKTTEVTDLRLP